MNLLSTLMRHSLCPMLMIAGVGCGTMSHTSPLSSSGPKTDRMKAAAKPADRTAGRVVTRDATSRTSAHSGTGEKATALKGTVGKNAGQKTAASRSAPAARQPALARIPDAESDWDNSGQKIVQTAYRQKGQGNAEAMERRAKGPKLSERLKIPSELPGADVAPLTLPPYDPDSPQIRELAIDQLFPDLPTIPEKVQLIPGAGDKPLTLEDLQQLAMSNNPLIVQANADIESAMGLAIDAGTHPNPIIGYEADTVSSSGTRNYQGVYMSQQIITAGKLELAQAKANVDVMNSQLNARKARLDLLARVRAQYFAVLVAKENETISEALVRFTDEAYRVQVEQLKGGQSAAYEPMQLRVLANQARAALNLAQNRYISASKQLAATIGIPDLPPVDLAGRADVMFPLMNYDEALGRVLNTHTEMLVARNEETQSRIALRLEEITPIPDVVFYGTLQKDFTNPAFNKQSYNMQIGVPVPLWDRNKGGIRAAQGKVVRSVEERARVRNELANKLADAFERYQNNLNLIEYYRTQIIPDQSRAYRGVYERHQQEPDAVGFGDIIVAQQALLYSITAYINALSAKWTAVTDLSALLQVESMQELQFLAQPAAELNPAPPVEINE